MSEVWWLNGERHRENGPAVIESNGYKAWWLNGKLQREDLPASIFADVTKEWNLYGKTYHADNSKQNISKIILEPIITKRLIEFD